MPGDNWTATVQLPAGGVFEYKYVVIDHNTKQAISWQVGKHKAQEDQALGKGLNIVLAQARTRMDPIKAAYKYSLMFAGHQLPVVVVLTGPLTRLVFHCFISILILPLLLPGRRKLHSRPGSR